MLSTLVSWLPISVRRQFEHRVTLLRAAENTGWIVANSALRIVIAMVVGVWVARYLGAAQFGLFNYAVSLIYFFRAFVPLGTYSLVMRDLARSHEDRYQILGSVFIIQVVVSVITVAAAIVVALVFQQDDPLSQKYTIILTLTLIIAPVEILVIWFQSQLLSVKLAIANVISLSALALARLWLVQIGAMLDAFIYILVVERLINVGVLLYLYHKSGESLFRWRFDRSRAWKLVREGMPLFWAAMAYTVYIRSSELMLMALAGATAVGYYAAANKISSLYLLVPAAMAASAMPIISRSRTENPTVYLTQFTNLLRIGSAIAIFSMVVVTFSANWVMPVLYGDEFAGAGPVLAISLWAVFPITLGVFSGNWVINEGLARIQFEKVLVTAGIVTGLNWLLIPDMGASGAALSMLSATVVSQIVWDFIDPRMRSYNMLKLHSFLPWWFGLDKIKLATATLVDSQAKVQDELREGELI